MRRAGKLEKSVNAYLEKERKDDKIWKFRVMFCKNITEYALQYWGIYDRLIWQSGTTDNPRLACEKVLSKTGIDISNFLIKG